MKRISLITFAALTLAQSLQAEPIREIGQTELRQNVTSGKFVALVFVLETIREARIGEPVDVRAFEAGGLFYRVLVRTAGGSLRGIYVDAATGAMLPTDAPLAQRLALAMTGQMTAIGQDDPSTSLSDRVKTGFPPENGNNI